MLISKQGRIPQGRQPLIIIKTARREPLLCTLKAMHQAHLYPRRKRPAVKRATHRRSNHRLQIWTRKSKKTQLISNKSKIQSRKKCPEKVQQKFPHLASTSLKIYLSRVEQRKTLPKLRQMPVPAPSSTLMVS